MKVADLLVMFRGIADDTMEPYFWSDDIFYAYLTDAANQYCRYGRPITDHTSPLTVVNYTINDPWVNYDERILKIVSAFDVDNLNNPLNVIDWSEYQKGTLATKDYGIVQNCNKYPDSMGRINTLISDMQENQLRVYHIPETNGTIRMIVKRLPLKAISESNQTFEGVPVHHRIDLLDWVMHRAYMHQDAEIFDPEKSANSRAVFMASMDQVKTEDLKRNSKPRTMSYGGI